MAFLRAVGGGTLLRGVEQTIATSVGCNGIGLHTGEPVDLTLKPAAAGTGILFVRNDGEHPVRFPARAEWVTDTTLATTLGNEDSRLSTIEHLVSALRGMGIDNCTISVSGPELPIMDGSAASFVYLIQQAGIRAQARMRRRLVIRRPIEVRDGNRYVRVGHELHQPLVAEIRANLSCWTLETPGTEREFNPESSVLQPALSGRRA